MSTAANENGVLVSNQAENIPYPLSVKGLQTAGNPRRRMNRRKK